MNYLTLLSAHNLALLSDWLDETGELYVDVYLPHSGGSSAAYLIRSLSDLKALLLKQNWQEIAITIFRRFPYPVRGIADAHLLEFALEQIPDGQPFDIVNLTYYPGFLTYCGDGSRHVELRRDLTEAFGDLVGIGQELDCLSSPPCDPAEVYEVNVLYRNDFKIRRNQDYYEPYAQSPKRYEWIEKLWESQENDQSVPPESVA